MATLFVHIPGTGILARELPQNEPLTIGEASENKLSIKSASVSPRHAEIKAVDGAYQLRDLGSANKSWINGVAVVEGGLKNGDSVRFGKIEGLFLTEGAEAEPAVRGRLTLSIPGEGEMIYQFDGDITTVGWKSDNDILVKDASISGHHAQFLQVGGKYKLRDLGSTNKTYLNQVPIVEAEVHDGDEIQFGAVRGRLGLQFGVRRAGSGGGASGEELKALKTELETFKTQADAFRKEREGLEFHNKQLSEEIQDLSAQIDRLKAEGQEREKALAVGGKNAEAALVVVKARVAGLEDELAATRKKTEAAERELRDAKAQVDALCGDQTGQQQKIATLMQARDVLRSEKEQIAEKLAEAQTRAEGEAKFAAEAARKQKEAEGRLLDQESAIGGLKAELEALNGKLAAALEKRDETLLKLENATRDREKDQGDAAEEVAAAEARAAKAEQELKTARQDGELTARQLQDAKALIETLSGGQTGDRQQIAALTQARDALQQEKDRLAADLAEAKTKAETAERDAESLRGANAEAQAQLKSLAEDRDRLRAFEKTLEERIEDLTKERERAKAGVTDLQTQVDMVLKDYDQAQATVTELQGKIETLTKERSEAQAATVKLQGQTEKLGEERDEARAFSAKLQAQIDTLTGERNEARATGDALKAKLDALAREHDGAKATGSELQARLDALAGERDAAKSASAETQATLQARLDTLAKERDEARAASAAAEQKLQALDREHQTSQGAAGKLQGELGALAKELETFKVAEAGLRSQLEVLIKERQTTQATLAELQTLLSAVTRERDTLKAAASQPAAQPFPQPQAPAQPAQPAPVVPAVMPTVKMPGLSAAQAPLPAASAPQPAAPPTAAFSMPKLSLAKDEPLPAAPAVDPRHSLIEIAPPAFDPQGVATRPSPLFGGGVPDLKKIVETAPEALNSMRRSLHAFIKNQMETSLLDEFQAGLHCMAEETRAAALTPVATLASALEMLVDDLKKIPGQINPSSLRTVSQAVDFLVTLINEKNLALTKDPTQARLFAVDDDPDARKTVLAALETLKLRVSSAADANSTLEAIEKEQFDLVLIDVGLPDINGFELCTRLRKLPNYKKVPVVFITGAVTVQNRVQSSLSGGNDFIAKPFNLLELGVKALIWIYKGQIGMM